MTAARQTVDPHFDRNSGRTSGLTLTLDLRMWRHSGIGRYLRNVVPLVLPQLDADTIRVLGRRALFAEDAGSMPPCFNDPRVQWIETPASVYSPAEQWLAFTAALRDPGLLWVPHYNVPLFYRGPLVATIHDIAPLAIAGLYGAGPVGRMKRVFAGRLIARAVRQASTLIAVSQFTADELVRRCCVPREKIAVIWSGLDANLAQGLPAGVQPHVEPDGTPYLLFVGNVKPNKNLLLLLRAFAEVQDRMLHRLVLAGRMDGMGTGDAAVLSLARAMGSRVRLAGEVSELELMRLYAGAAAFVLPSRYEGFGLPLLEAMRFGCPVLAASVGSLPEIAGPAALYFDPNDRDGLAALLLRTCDAGEMDGLRAAGTARLRDFSFERSATATAGVLNAALAASRAGARQ